ncbi:MAG: hypothetical protein IT183_14400 [Acidobacteria bacterium]|nr:hypothetical protein [Acidobacteriota bacterium]
MQPGGLTRDSLERLQRLLIAGLGAFWLVIGVLYWLSAVPLLPDIPVPDVVPVAITAVIQIVAWLWARRRVPRRRPMMSLSDFWTDGATTAAAALPIFLFEGSATLAAVWTMLTASPATAVVSVLGVLGIAASGPAVYEDPDF